MIHEYPMKDEKKRVDRLTRILSGELFKALGFSHDGMLSSLLSPLVRKPINRFAEICVGFDQRLVKLGFQGASQWIMPNFAPGITASGVSAIPPTGPLLITSNHPGAHDSLVISSNLPRDDLKIVVNIPFDFISEIPATLSHFLYAPHDAYVRMNVVRSAINHLKSGGALLLFASGRIDPDPSTMDGAEKELERWSRSLEIILRKVPNAKLLISIVSNILNPRYINHYLTWFRRERPDKQRISEFLQVMNQMQTPELSKQIPMVTFSEPLTYHQVLNRDVNESFMESILDLSKQLLEVHLNYF